MHDFIKRYVNVMVLNLCISVTKTVLRDLHNNIVINR